jgi:hypothetical protein
MRRTVIVSGAFVGAFAIYALILRPRHLRWGATTSEVDEVLPGDDLLPDPDLQSTRAIAIAATAEQVWPWLAQLGQGRGGFYSYDGLENLIGRCDIHSADHVVEEWQTIDVGDAVHLHPDVALTVAVVDPGRTLVLRGGVPITNVDGAPPEAPFDFTWTFALHDTPGGTTRLLMRERYAYTQRWARAIVEPVEAVSFIMSQKMLRTIRDHAVASSTKGRRSGRPDAADANNNSSMQMNATSTDPP